MCGVRARPATLVNLYTGLTFPKYGKRLFTLRLNGNSKQIGRFGWGGVQGFARMVVVIAFLSLGLSLGLRLQSRLGALFLCLAGVAVVHVIFEAAPRIFLGLRLWPPSWRVRYFPPTAATP